MPNRSIREIIAHQKILSAPETMTVREAAIRMAEAKVGAMLILDHGKLTGIFTERDILNRVVAKRLDPDATPLSQVMTSDPRTISADKPLAHALVMMDEGGYRHVPVMDNGQPVGMVSARDALGAELIEFENELQRREHLTEIML
ncbi:MAG: CBS domain-containing protein [Rhodocyclaceae bacterium]|nr:MAG: CBS domain-containing protein [Rhodocyclaceae bacterium]